MNARHDRGLRAVARVREVRERDSRIGVQRALEEQRAREGAAARLLGQLESSSTDATEIDDVSSYVAQRTMLQAMAGALSSARADAESAAVVSAAATAHWQSDHSRLAAVEGLLEARAEQRRAEAAHDEAKEQDDAASRQWLRRAGGRSA